MIHPFAQLEPEYLHLLSVAKITRPGPVREGVNQIMRVLSSYIETSTTTSVPASWLGPADCREDDCNPRCGIGQGDPWNRVSRHVPAGCGPFQSKAEADRFYLHYDHIDRLDGVSAWSLAYAAWRWECWNGFGPRGHGRLSGYLFSCTDLYDPPRLGGRGNAGKYVADDVWDPNAVDEQPGAVALYLELVQRRPDLAIGGAPTTVVPAPSVVPAPVPVGLHDAEMLQKDLNALGAEPPLAVDGNFGRMTTRAVKDFQRRAGIAVDGFAGDQTWDAIEAKLAA